MKNVAKGSYTVVVKKIGYVPYPRDDIDVNVTGDIRVSDVWLWADEQNAAYYATVAAKIVDKIATQNNQRELLVDEWNNLRSINMSPSSKVLLAKELDKRDAGIKYIYKEIGDYVAVDPENVKHAQFLFAEALAGANDVPERSAFDGMSLSDVIVADLVIHQLKRDNVSEESRKAFIEQFQVEWNGSGALQMLAKYPKRKF